MMNNNSQLNSLTGLEIAIVGMAGRFPGASDLIAFWNNLRSGVESLSIFSDEELAASGVAGSVMQNPAYVRSRGILQGAELFDASFFGYYPREAQILDPQQRVFLECAWEALENSGYDPAEFSGSIGVFAGAGTNDYLMLLVGNPDLLSVVDAFQLAWATEKDFLATRVSYKLGLEGPSFTVQTGCSTSLVATHLACQSLLNGECDMALAGGVSICIPQRVGYISVKGGILSPDGHCRAFDARAQGTVSGDGVGIVTLKRLRDALEAHDTIRAVIKGSAINNDGSRKVGFTAPSVEGQTRVIRAAHVASEIEPETVSYVEAHGTATSLGDPIEIAALTQAFRYGTDERCFCGIGSVKTNIGHTEAAAGIAGLIKTVLALEHREMPPSLHFERPNPEIDFASSPFYVNTALRPWDNKGVPRRAGVSSTGIGGTNAHIVLEEAPPHPEPGPSRKHQLLVLSTKTETALARAAANLATHLRRHPDLDLADVAYTLQVGRRGFAHRLAFVCETVEEATTILERNAPDRLLPAVSHAPDRPVVFMFPGGGAQYTNMARDLYHDEPVFREQVDRCVELLLPQLGLDLRTVLYPSSAEEVNGTVNRSIIFPAALFVVEYALTRLWTEWGIRPEAMIGHSLGEYVAACHAGVFSLEDALALIALRGRLFEQLPAGAMLSVALPESELEPLLASGLVIAAINAPRSCVASGPANAIDALEQRLATRRVYSQRLHINIAAHSAAVEQIMGEFSRFLRSCRLHAPNVPFLSNVTGTWITEEQATDPQYWVTHLRQTVRFSDGIAELLSEPTRVFLEVGPGWTLSSLVRSHGEKGQIPLVLSSIRHAQDEQLDTEFALGTLGRLWLAGVSVSWPTLYKGQLRRRVPLPSYPFERQRYWVETGQRSVYGTYNGCDNPESRRTGSPATPERKLEMFDHTDTRVIYRAPRYDTEHRLVGIWESLFGIEGIGVDDNFFELGGHSLLATRMLFQVNDAFHVELSLKSLLRAPTVSELAATVDRSQGMGTLTAEPILDVASEAHLDEEIVPPTSVGAPHREQPAVLLTGSNGYLGAYLLYEMLHHTQGEIYCLVRGATAAGGIQRIYQALQGYQLWDEREAHRIIPVIGDLALPQLGLSNDEFDTLARQVDVIYHCGARVHFTYPYASLKASNVLGTQEVLRLATRGSLKPVHHISTTAVFPPASDSSITDEDSELSNVDALPTGYAQSKWVAEKLIGIARIRGIPVAIYRPGTVTGDTRTGICRTDDAVWRMLKSCIQLGMAPEVDTEVASAPVDYVSRAIVHIAQFADSLGKNFHLTAPTTTRWRDIFAFASVLGYPLRQVSYAEWRAKLADLKGAQDNALFPLIHLVDRDQPEAPHSFNCRNALEALAGSDIRCSSLDAERLRQYCAYFVKTGFLEPLGQERSARLSQGAHISSIRLSL